jgi:hypothetical protein
VKFFKEEIFDFWCLSLEITLAYYESNLTLIIVGTETLTKQTEYTAAKYVYIYGYTTLASGCLTSYRNTYILEIQ